MLGSNKLLGAEGCATICDGNGNLLFYTNGPEIIDSTNTLMQNGGNMYGQSTNTQLQITRRPGTDSIYYYFMTEMAGAFQTQLPTGFRYAIIDLGLNNGLGAVTIKNQLLFDRSGEQVTAIRHGNGTDIWIIAHEATSNKFRCYLLTCNGLDTNAIISQIGCAPTDTQNGYLKGSPDGQYIASVCKQSNSWQLFKFDRLTGVISNSLTFSFNLAYGIEFSPNSKKIYVNSSLQTSRIIQYDITSYNQAAIEASKDTIWCSWPIVGGMQLGPNDKIYVSRTDLQPTTPIMISSIEFPDSNVPACQYVDTLVIFPNNSSGGSGLPHLNPARPLPTANFTMDKSCPLDTSFFFGVFNYKRDSVIWNFGDPSSGLLNNSKSDTTFHIYQNPGQYIVTLISYRSCESDTTIDTITIGPPQISLDDTAVCDAQPTTLDAGISNMKYLWSTGDTTQTIPVNNPGSYSVTVTDSLGCSKSDTSIVSLDMPVTANFQIDTSGCPTVMFLDSSNGNPTGWQWFVNDSSIANSQFANFQFPSNGQFKVTLIVSDNCGFDTINDTLSIDCIVGTEDGAFMTSMIEIFPNPNDGTFTVKTDPVKDQQAELLLYNLFGQTILEKELDNSGVTRVQSQNTPAGIYFAEITIGTRRFLKKLIISSNH